MEIKTFDEEIKTRLSLGLQGAKYQKVIMYYCNMFKETNFPSKVYKMVQAYSLGWN